MSLFTAAMMAIGVMLIVFRARWRERRRALGLLLSFYAVLVLYCTPAVAFVLVRFLESWHPALERCPDNTKAIVVLAGRIYSPGVVGSEASPGEPTLSRCIHAARLYRQVAPCSVIVSGGPFSASASPTSATVMRDFLIELGVRPVDLRTEATSRTTHENAANVAKLLDPGAGKVVLVTDALHLPRAALCFEHEGLPVEPAGCLYHFTTGRVEFNDFLPQLHGASLNQAALHELLGLVWYRFRGYL